MEDNFGLLVLFGLTIIYAAIMTYLYLWKLGGIKAGVEYHASRVAEAEKAFSAGCNYLTQAYHNNYSNDLFKNELLEKAYAQFELSWRILTGATIKLTIQESIKHSITERLLNEKSI